MVDHTLLEGTIFMNFLVFLNTQAGELEKILSGTKSMLLKEFDPAGAGDQAINPGDSLYFLRDDGDCDLRVKATVIRVLTFLNQKDDELSHLVKEMQPKLQLTEDQYNEWLVKGHAVLVEFGCAQKIDMVHVELDKITDRSANGSRWIAFEELSQGT
jgi:hypothetical protein